MVTFIESYPQEVMEKKRLIKFDLGSLSYQKIDPKSKEAKSNNKRSIQTRSSSAFPEIDNYIRNLVKNSANGDHKNHGYIRKVQMSPCGWFLTYEFGNYRYCHNISRDHKSNNVKLVVDLKANKVGQTCHDPDCQDFR